MFCFALLFSCPACIPTYLDAGAMGPLLQITTSPAGAAVGDAKPIFDSIEGRVGHHGVTVVELANHELLAAWYSYEGPHELDGASIFTAKLPVGSDEWTTPTRIEGLPDRSANPLLFIDGDTIHLLFAYVPQMWWSATLMQCDSTDGGATWSAPRDIGAGLGGNVRNPPILFDDGSWLLPAYSDFWLHGFLLRSTDGTNWTRGTTWIAEGDNALLQPAIARSDDAESLLMVARNRGGHRIDASASNDLGVNWTRPIETEFPNPDSAVALARLSDHSLLMVFNDSGEDRTPLVAVRSTDGGATWGDRRVLADDEREFSYPTIVESSERGLMVFYSEGRERIVWVGL
ncbi:MAG: exo-alpha-sialidase [Phycisphaerales bacterium]|nr:exo-alpha-sialidase [Phycisphaerales bacterium]